MKIWAQLVIGVARKLWRNKTPLLDEFVCFQIGIKDCWLEVFNFFREELPLSQNLCYFRGSRLKQCVLLSTALQCSLPSNVFKLIFVLCNYQTCTFTFNLNEICISILASKLKQNTTTKTSSNKQKGILLTFWFNEKWLT